MSRESVIGVHPTTGRRVLDINDLDTITADVIDTARGALVIGT